MRQPVKHLYGFGPFLVDPTERLLLRDGKPVPLRPKAFDMLLLLAENSGHILGKDELLQRVWPGTFVEENNLSQNISLVRKALGGEADGSNYIETVPGRGYRFIVPVSERWDEAAPMLSKPIAEHPVRPVDTAEPAPDRIERTPIPTSTTPPETRYAKSGDVNIAYQVIGDGPIDLVYVPGWVTHLEYAWEEPSLARYYQRLASFSRLLLFDKRGTGLSDQTAGLPTLEQRMDDVRAVMDAVGSERAALFGASEGGNMCVLFAATYPERTAALVTYGIYAKRIWHPEYPWAPTTEEREAWFRALENGWGGVVDLATLAPSVAGDARFTQWWASYLRRSASPGAALALGRANTEIDVRHVLPTIRVPTLVLHRAGDLDVKVDEGRYIASRVPGAKYVELPGIDHLPWVGDQDAALDEVEAFVTGVRHTAEPDRVLATVLVASVIGSSAEHERDDSRWRAILTRYQTGARREIEWFRGREIGSSREQFVATFDGPARAIRCACAMSALAGRAGIAIRIGLHTGECDVVGDRVSGVAVDIAARVAARAGPGEVLVSSMVRGLVGGSGIRFGYRGSRVLDESLGGRLSTVEP